MFRAVVSILSVLTVGFAAAQTRKHIFSFNGIAVQGDEKISEKRDKDGDLYFVYQSPATQPVKYVRIIYQNPASWWKDQQYCVGYSPNSSNPFMRVPSIDYPNDVMWTFGYRSHNWSPEARDFIVNPGGENDVPEWLQAFSSGQPGPSSISWTPYGLPGAFRHGFATQWPGRVPLVKEGTYLSFWPGPRTEVSPIDEPNIFDEFTDPAGDPNKDGWGAFLSLEWWRNLMVYLFVPSETDLQVVKDAFAQFTQWGPFKLIADVSSALGTLAGGTPASTNENMRIQLPTFYLNNGQGITGNIDLRPYGAYLQMVRAFVLGLAMIRIARFWGTKIASVGRAS